MTNLQRNWCATLNNYTKEQEDILKDQINKEYFKYLIYGHEIAPTTKTPHLQIYFQLNKKQQLNKIKKTIGIEQLHLIPARGTYEENRTYTTKEDKQYIELGKPTKERQRKDLDTYYEDIVKAETFADVLRMKPTKQYLKYAKEVYNSTHNKVKKQENIHLRPFQQHIIDLISKPADDRTIYWVYDKEGNTGKTYLSKYLISNYNAFYFRPAKGTDILYQYNNQTIIILDIPRSSDEQYINWGILEQLKDGITFSGKYEGKTLYRAENAHVIVMSNELPPNNTFSKDRIIIIDPTTNTTYKNTETNKQIKLNRQTNPLDNGVILPEGEYNEMTFKKIIL